NTPRSPLLQNRLPHPAHGTLYIAFRTLHEDSRAVHSNTRANCAQRNAIQSTPGQSPAAQSPATTSRASAVSASENSSGRFAAPASLLCVCEPIFTQPNSAAPSPRVPLPAESAQATAEYAPAATRAASDAFFLAAKAAVPRRKYLLNLRLSCVRKLARAFALP